MHIISGKVQESRIRIKVGIRPFQPSEPVSGMATTVDLNFREYIALVDTGATRTCVTEKVVQELGLRRRGRVEIWNIKRSEEHWTYLFHVGIWPDLVGETSIPTVFGIGSEIEGIDVGNNRFFDVLLGMDIISQGAFRVEKSGDFSLEF